MGPKPQSSSGGLSTRTSLSLTPQPCEHIPTRHHETQHHLPVETATRACYARQQTPWIISLVVVQPCAYPTRDEALGKDLNALDPAARNAHIYTRTNHSLQQLLHPSTPPNTDPESLSHARRACLIAPKVAPIEPLHPSVYPRLSRRLAASRPICWVCRATVLTTGP